MTSSAHLHTMPDATLNPTSDPAAPAPALVVAGVSKAFGRGHHRTVAVDDVSITLDADRLLALVGPSGCGKSTLLRLVAGLLAVERGTITLAGRVVDDGRQALPPERRNVGLVFQEHALFPHLTIAANVGFGVRDSSMRGMRVAEMLDLVGLAGHADRYPHELSGGERQRVALARALAPRPALLLLDEPFASLDPNMRAHIRDEVVAILRSTSTPAVFVTHDQNEALAVGDQIAVMRGGRIDQIGSPQEVFHAPRNRFVAAFMGEADFVTAADLALLGVPVTPALAGAAAVMVRPDDIAVTPSPDGPGRVVAAEFRGATWCYTVDLPCGTTLRALRSHLDRIEIGTTVSAAVHPGHHPVPLPSG